MVVNEVTSSVQSGKTAAVTVAAIGAMAAGSALAADLGHFTEADSGKTFVVKNYLGNNLGRWDGRDITLDGQTDVTIQSSGMTFGKVIGKDATINFVNDRADGMSTGLLIDGKIDPVHTYSTGPMTVKGSSSKTPVAKPDGTKMFCSAFLNDARMCCFFCQYNSKILT